MEFRDYLDLFIEESVGNMLEADQMTYLLLSEDFAFCSLEGPISLLETVKRIRMKVAGGGYVTRRRQGRPNPRLSIIARRRARNPQTKQKIKRAKARPTSKMRAAKTRAARKRFMPSKPRPSGRRGAHGAKRHAGPRVHRSTYRRR